MAFTIVAAVIVGTLALALSLQIERKRRAALARYWSRGCAGHAWRTSFPTVTRHEIREFLYIVIDTFGFEKSRALQLSPLDTIMGLYRACYPDPSAPDALETERLAHALAKRYGLAQLTPLPDAVTFGELFALVTVKRLNINSTGKSE